MDQDIQPAIPRELQEPSHINRLAHQALDKGGAFGIDPSYHWSRQDPPSIHSLTKEHASFPLKPVPP